MPKLPHDDLGAPAIHLELPESFSPVKSQQPDDDHQ